MSTTLTNLTGKIMKRVVSAQKRESMERFYLAAASVVISGLAFTYTAAQLISSLLGQEILSVFSGLEFDLNTLPSGVLTSALILWTLVDKPLLATGAITFLVLVLIIKQDTLVSSLRRLRELTKYEETLNISS